MAIGKADGHEPHLSADARRLYGAIARHDWEHADQITQRNPQARQELLGSGLIGFTPGQTHTPFVRNPTKALRGLMDRELDEARARVERLAQLPDLADELAVHYRAQQIRTGRGSEYLDDQALVNARIGEVVDGAKREILAAQPGGPRSKDILEVTVERDTAALDRGVGLRTIYRATVRDDALTAEYAKAMSTCAPGRRAEYRTLPGDFVRMIIVDREQAFIPDYVVDGAPEHSAWYVTDRAVVAVLAEMFHSKWRLAEPWHGELRPRRGRADVDTISSADGLVTTARQREIMRSLMEGLAQGAVARQIGVSKRTLEEEIAALKRISGAQTPMQLAFWWAHSPDSRVGDTTTAGGGQPVPVA